GKQPSRLADRFTGASVQRLALAGRDRLDRPRSHALGVAQTGIESQSLVRGVNRVVERSSVEVRVRLIEQLPDGLAALPRAFTLLNGGFDLFLQFRGSWRCPQD